VSDLSFKPIPFSDDKKVENFAKKYLLDKDKLVTEGLDAEDVGKMPLDTYRQVAGYDGKITKADVINFVDNQVKDSSIVATLEKALNSGDVSIPTYRDENGKDINLKWTVKLTDEKGLSISVANRDNGKSIAPADVMFSLLNSKDIDHDGKISVEKEVIKNQFLNSVQDALELAGDDHKISA
jgi:large exoprotein involved in heme utilization and adhesion